MASGKPSDDSKEFGLKSCPRSCMKREFSFALKIHTEFPASIGRTRSGKIRSPPPCNGISADLSNRRIKTSSADESVEESKKKIDFEEISIKKEGLGIETRIVVEEIGRTRSGKIRSPPPCDGVSADLSNKRIKASSADESVEESKKIDLEEISIKKEGSGIETCIIVEETGRTRSGKIRSPPPCIVVSDDLSNKRVKASGAEESVEKSKKSDLEEISINKEGSGIATPIAEESAEELNIGSLEEISIKKEGSEIETPIAEEESKKGDLDEISIKKEGSGIATNIAKESAEESKKSNSEEIQIKKEGSGIEAPIVIDDIDLEKIADGDVKLTTPPPPPVRRFTRSLSKPSISEAKSMVGGSAAVESDAKTAPKKLELKMALNRLPSTLKELLSTGLLEGLPVKYIFRGNKNGLQGTIKGDGILCSCSSCNGSKVVTAVEFEQHAGSLNKYPTKYLHFENGKTFREILNACKRAPLDMLESTIQRAIGLSSVKEDDTYQNCKESFPSSRVGELELTYNKCVESDQSQESPASPETSDRLPKLRSKLKSSDSTSKQLSSQEKHDHARLTKKDMRLHKLVFMEDVLPDGTEVAYYALGKRLLEGYKVGNLIFCRCCNTEISPSQFEAHAGFASRRKPYLNIYTSNGVSLHELSVSLSKGQKFSASDNDDLCTICADGGDLLLCDGCPRAFHEDCVGLSSIPCGNWYCKYCETMYEKEKAVAFNANALAAGRILGVDPIEQISERCIRIVKRLKTSESDTDTTVCVLCRGHDFSKSGFGPRTVLLCDQCEREYHVGCLKIHKMGYLKELPEGKWFCCDGCNMIHTALQKLILRGSEVLPSSLSGVIKQKHVENSSSNCTDLDIRWRLLSGKITSSDSRLLLSKAVAIFHNCFDPIVGSTGRDLIPSMVYGRNLRDQEFGGMYCAVLTVNSSVVSAGILRIFGQEVAELPLVATSSENQGKGYFQALFLCIERFLGFLNVKNLLLPAADEAESIWTKKFGFKKISQDELCKYTKDFHMMNYFQGTSMLHKLVPKCRIVRKPTKGS